MALNWRCAMLFTLLTTGCASVVSEMFNITVSEEASDDFSAASPGLVLTEGWDRVAAVLCGGDVAPFRYHISRNYACMSNLEGQTETRVAWIQPMPSTWDAAALCAMPGPDPVWRGVTPGTEVVGEDSFYFVGLPQLPPEDAWSGEGNGVWRTQPLSSCSGGVSIDIDIE